MTDNSHKYVEDAVLGNGLWGMVDDIPQRPPVPSPYSGLGRSSLHRDVYPQGSFPASSSSSHQQGHHHQAPVRRPPPPLSTPTPSSSTSHHQRSGNSHGPQAGQSHSAGVGHGGSAHAASRPPPSLPPAGAGHHRSSSSASREGPDTGSGENKMVACKACGKEYQWRSSLSHHMKTCHPDFPRRKYVKRDSQSGSTENPLFKFSSRDDDVGLSGGASRSSDGTRSSRPHASSQPPSRPIPPTTASSSHGRHDASRPSSSSKARRQHV